MNDFDFSNDLEINFYSEEGLITSFNKSVQVGKAIIFNIRKDLKSFIKSNLYKLSHYIWYVIKSAHRGVTAPVGTCNETTKHCSVEHSF